MAKDIVMGIDIGTSAVKTLILEQRNDELLPNVLGIGTSPSHGLRKGFVIDSHETTISIKDSANQAKKSAGVNIKEAFVSIGGSGLQGTRSKGSIAVGRADREINENDLKRAVSQSEAQLNRNSSTYLLNREILHRFPINYKIDGETAMGDPIGMKAEKLEVETFFITAMSQHVNALVKSMDMAGIAIEDIAATPLAMSRALLTKQEKEVGSMIINIGGDTSSIIVFEEGNPISLEVFPIGSNHITYDIARGFQISLIEAEEMKLSYDRGEPSLKKKLNGIIEPRLNDIFELVESHLKKINRVGLLPAGVILTGGGANLSNIDEIAKKILLLPTQIGKIKFLEDAKHPAANPVWSTAFGLCLTNLEDKIGQSAITGRRGSFIKKTIGKWLRNLLP